ncbi:MAG: glycine zipper 2TM domain-containing protein [Novosphingobium sp.]|nr:glycine zipper 2TM domain-containing protein [Novosphingobium sp.]
MKQSKLVVGSLSAALFAVAFAGPADARRYHHYRGYTAHHRCLRFDKTTGTVAGAAGGGLIGHAIGGGTGTVVGAVGGGLLGHHLARNGPKRC